MPLIFQGMTQVCYDSSEGCLLSPAYGLVITAEGRTSRSAALLFHISSPHSTEQATLHKRFQENNPKLVWSKPADTLRMINVNYPICKIQITQPLYFLTQEQISLAFEMSWKSQVLTASITACYEMQYYYNNNDTRFRLLHFSGHQPKTLTKHSPSGEEKSLQHDASCFIVSFLCSTLYKVPASILPAIREIINVPPYIQNYIQEPGHWTESNNTLMFLI